MKVLKILFVMLFPGFLISCSNLETVLHPYEKKLGLDSSNAQNFHSMIYSPPGSSLNYPGYIVAIEKAPQDKVGGPKVDKSASFIQAGKYINGEEMSWLNTQNKINQFQSRDAKAMFVSHIVKNIPMAISQGKGLPYFYNSHCFVYNSWSSISLVSEPQADLVKINDWHSCNTSVNFDNSKIDPVEFYKQGSRALTSLKENLTQDLRDGSYSHILVIVMGWNTSQNEAVRNFNDLTGNILSASLEAKNRQQEVSIDRSKALKPTNVATSVFRPLVIGITWPSYWSTNIGNVLSYSNKANDADEIGLSWLNRIINETLKDGIAESGVKIPVIALGHSFGARAMTRSLFSSPVLISTTGQLPDQTMITSPVNLAVALQGAVSINRFSPPLSDEGAPYRDYNKLTDTKIVLTASSSDKALGSPFLIWTDPAGSIKAYQKACTGNDYKNIFNCIKASDTSAQIKGRFAICQDGMGGCNNPFQKRGSDRKIEYIDASSGITEFNSPGTGGGAHSDIYRLPMGRLLWKLIQEYAMN